MNKEIIFDDYSSDYEYKLNEALKSLYEMMIESVIKEKPPCFIEDKDYFKEYLINKRYSNLNPPLECNKIVRLVEK